MLDDNPDSHPSATTTGGTTGTTSGGTAAGSSMGGEMGSSAGMASGSTTGTTSGGTTTGSTTGGTTGTTSGDPAASSSTSTTSSTSSSPADTTSGSETTGGLAADMSMGGMDPATTAAAAGAFSSPGAWDTGSAIGPTLAQQSLAQQASDFAGSMFGGGPGLSTSSYGGLSPEGVAHLDGLNPADRAVVDSALSGAGQMPSANAATGVTGYGMPSTLSPSFQSPTDMGSAAVQAMGYSPDTTNLQQMANAAEQAYGLPQGMLGALIQQESGWNPQAAAPTSSAKGLTQLISGTARQMGVTNPFDPMQSIFGGAHYLDNQMTTFGSPEAALGAYYAGPGNFAQSGFAYDPGPGAPSAGQYADAIMSHIGTPSGPGSSYSQGSQIAANIDPTRAQEIPNPTGFDPQAAQVSALSQAMQVDPESMFINAAPTLPQTAATTLSSAGNLAQTLFGGASGVTSYPAQQTSTAAPGSGVTSYPAQQSGLALSPLSPASLSPLDPAAVPASPTRSVMPSYETPDFPIGQTPPMAGQTAVPGTTSSPATADSQGAPAMAGGSLSPVGYNARTQAPVDAGKAPAVQSGVVPSAPGRAVPATPLDSTALQPVPGGTPPSAASPTITPASSIEEPSGVQPGLSAPSTGEKAPAPKDQERVPKEVPLPSNVAETTPPAATAPSTGGWSIGGIIDAGKKKATELASTPEAQKIAQAWDYGKTHPGTLQMAASLFGGGPGYQPSDQGPVGQPTNWAQGGFQSGGSLGAGRSDMSMKASKSPDGKGEIPTKPDGSVDVDKLIAMIFGDDPSMGGFQPTINQGKGLA